MGSQGSEFISNFSTKLIKNIDRDRKININFIFQCSNTMIDKVKSDLENVKSNVIIKEYFYDIDNILNKTTVAISRAGAGSISDLMLYKIPSILIPLPTAKDNHQFYNASLLHKHDLAIILSQDEYELDNAKKYIYKIYDNKNRFDFMNKQFDKIFVKNSNSLIYKLITNEK